MKFKHVKRSRYYIFNNEESIWYLNKSGEWSIVNGDRQVYACPWGCENNAAVDEYIEYLSDDGEYSNRPWEYVRLTKKELEEHMFLKAI